MARYRHIMMRGLGEESKEFQAFGGGSKREISQVQNRLLHAQNLRESLATISSAIRDAAANQAENGVPKNRRGVAVAVSSREGQELVVGTRRAGSRGMQLLSVRRAAEPGGDRGQDRAVLFLTENSVRSLNKSLGKYEDWVEDTDAPFSNLDPDETEQTGPRKPPNFWLFETTAGMRIARIQDLWTDSPENFPRERGEVEWEVWVRSHLADAFAAGVVSMDLELRGKPTRFVDVEVHNLIATRAELNALIAASAAIVELRGASDFIAEHANLPPAERLVQAKGIADRIVAAPTNAPWITLLDTGVNRNNPLLTSSLPADRCHAVLKAWNPMDADGHGSKMAGVALFGDIDAIARSRQPIALEVGLESITAFSPSSGTRIPARDAITRAIRKVEKESVHPRVFCLAATAVGEREDGRPTGTSATLDTLAFHDGDAGRLICVAVGNVVTSALEPYRVEDYTGLNADHGIQSPAQAVNVLSVGACTIKCSGPSPLADDGGLSPRSRTAQLWRDFRTHKPDILMEGGNHGIDPGGRTSRPHAPDMVLTTSNIPVERPITFTGDTSAACAAAARLAGRVMARYPGLRPETVRALLVHNAEWTDAMLARQSAMVRAGASQEAAWQTILDCFGWGIPNEERVFWSAENALTLIAEDSIMPYERSGANVKLRQMKYFRLPWPEDALRALRDTEVELRCTLSYFVEPDPHSASLERWQMYPSHSLRLDFQRYGESERSAIRRVNRAMDPNDRDQADDAGWLLGKRNRTRGTLHHDIWRGPAYQLADRHLVTVSPVRGWWAGSKEKSPENAKLNFSLVASIRTPSVENDLVADTIVRVPAGVRVDVPAVIEV